MFRIFKRAEKENSSSSRTNPENENVNDEEYCNNEDEEVGELLKLTLGRTTGLNQPEPKQFFICKYCSRKFYSPQALGGHQNAHKREKIVANASYFPNRRWNSDLNSPYARALGIQTRSLVQNPNREMYDMVARFSDPRDGFCAVSCALPIMHLQPTSNMIWPGSFQVRSTSQPAEPPLLDQLDLDLNLKL
ncbi:Zinc finger protein [Thalictrum thalictroides]|uniref:Zinc finger protein n=1 Tax=Thalictrum thalictroides TaxID=46969 RepID=A0A7J6W464_THATH|nr:Zinc finger protein [Thalictrum thalictroides]